jgi:hypothetical protein
VKCSSLNKPSARACSKTTGEELASAGAHRADVEHESRGVMPFSIDLTKHLFTPTANGGTQAVLVPDGDGKQIALARSHLRKEPAAFARGDYSDPAAIHGSAMPGLASLQRSRGKIQVSYADVSNGAKIVFVTQDAQLVDALHRWFSAQVSRPWFSCGDEDVT